jgi:hypothetical protein
VTPAVVFYQSLAGVSFTLLGLWFAVLSLGHESWRGAERHRSTLHIALHFLLPGAASLAALLAGDVAGGLIWRVAFILVGFVGLGESLPFLRSPEGPRARPGRTLRALDPWLYAAIIGSAFIQPGMLPVAPLQVEGTIVAGVLLTGLSYVWLAFAERLPADRTSGH